MINDSYPDAPITCSSDDMFDRVHSARVLHNLIERANGNHGRTVIGLCGTWGAGKSSTLNLTREILSNSQPTCKVVEFRPWIYADYSSLLGGFFSTLEEAMPKERRRSVRRRLARYVKYVAPIGKAVPGFDASGLIDSISTSIRPPSELSIARERVERELEAISYPILIIIEDLDRLHPAEVVLVFKLIREIAKFPNVTYLLSFDQGTVFDLLTNSDLAINDRHRAGEYLDKILQVRLDLPPLHEKHYELAFGRGIDQLLSVSEINLSDSEIHQLYSTFRRDMGYRLGTPRAINRLFSQLSSAYPHVRGEVNFADFFVMTFLQIFEPTVYSALPVRRSRLTGSVGWDHEPDPDRDRDAEQRRRYADTFLDDVASKSDHKSLRRLLSRLFSEFSSATAPARDERQLALSKKIESVDYFDRYFHIGIPPGDVPDKVVIAALDDMSNGRRDSVATENFRQLVISNSATTLHKANVLVDLTKAATYRYIIEEILTVYDKLSRDDYSSTDGSSADRAETFIGYCLHLASESESADIARNLLLTSNWRLLAQLTVSMPQEYVDVPGWIGEVKPFLLERISSELEQMADVPVLDIEDERFAVISYWAFIGDYARVREWLWHQVESGRWSLPELLSRFVTTKTIRDPRGAESRLDEVRSSAIKALFHVDSVIDRLGKLMESNYPPLQSFPSLPATTENRMNFVLAYLADIAKQRPRRKQTDDK